MRISLLSDLRLFEEGVDGPTKMTTSNLLSPCGTNRTCLPGFVQKYDQFSPMLAKCVMVSIGFTVFQARTLTPNGQVDHADFGPISSVSLLRPLYDL